MNNGHRESFAQKYIDGLCRVLQDIPFPELARALEILERAYVEGRQVFLAGNGGSAATASHTANDLVKGVALAGQTGIRAIALTDNVPLMTAIANDESYAEIFARPLAQFGRPGDILIAISASGNSPNVVRAVEVARQMEMTTIGFLGMGGGKVAKMVDVPVIVKSNDYGPVEDVHMVFDHLSVAYLRAWLSEKPDDSNAQQERIDP
jgi:D-sedoheptulose 7-phosphate isomerase